MLLSNHIFPALFFLFTDLVILAGARPIAIITGGTRGIGSGISQVLAENGYDLLLTFNSNKEAADEFANTLTVTIGGELTVKCVGGDISLSSTRDDIFKALDSMTEGNGDDECESRLAVLVHNAGQYVGITSDNSDGIEARSLAFGDGSLLDEDGRPNFDTMHYYQKMYGDAFVDLCERSLARMGNIQDGGGGSIVGISSPGVTPYHYNPNKSYSMPGSGKTIMEYSMRLYAAMVAERGINVNVIVPGVTKSDAWDRMAKRMGAKANTIAEGLVEKRVPMRKMIYPKDIGNVVQFLCSETGKFVTGTVLPVDGGLHLIS